MIPIFRACPVPSNSCACAHSHRRGRTLPGCGGGILRNAIRTGLAIAFLPLLTHAATLTWTNELGGDWRVAGNWSPNQVPGSNDRAVIQQGGTYTVTATSDLTVGAIELGSEPGPGLQTLDLNGFSLTLGSDSAVKPSGILRLAANGNALVTIAVTLVNDGTVIWNSGTIYSGAGGTFRNRGVWEAQGDHLLTWGTVGVPFHNSGTFRKSGGTGTTTLEANVLNTGTLEVQSGTVALINGGSCDAPGMFKTEGGTTLSFSNGYTFNSGSRLEGSGEARLLTGSFTVNGDLTATGLTFQGGFIGGTHVLHGQFKQAGANWQTSGTTTLATGSTLEITDALVFPFRTWINEGVILWKAGTITGGAGGEIQNRGLWEAQGDDLLTWSTVGLPFRNTGTFRKTAGGGTTTLEANVLNTGTLEVQSGTVALINGGNNEPPGTFQTGEGTVLRFTSGYTFNSGSRFVGLGDVQLVNGSFTINGDLTAPRLTFSGGFVGGTHVLNGQYTWAGAAWNSSGTTTLASGSTAQITGSLPLSFRSLTNHGTVLWREGAITIGGGGMVHNHGLWEALGDNVLTTVTDGSSFVNLGTFRKAGGNGITTLEAAVSNQGLVDIQSGTLAQTYGGRNLVGGTVQFAIRGPSDFGKLHLPGNSALAGSLSATLQGGYVPAAGSSFPLITYGSLGGAFDDFQYPFAAAWSTNYGPSSFNLSVLNSRPQWPLQTDLFTDELTPLVVATLATDVDLPANKLSYSLETGPAGTTLSAEGILSWTPGEADGPGTNLITVVVTDNGVPPLSATNAFRVAVREVNTPPTLTFPAMPDLPELVAWIASAQASDSDLPTNALTISLVSGPPGLTVSPTGEIQWTPAEADGPGLQTLTLRVTDQNPKAVNETELSTTVTVTLKVREVNQPPSLSVPANPSVIEELPLLLSAQALDPDLPANPLSFRLLAPPDGLSIDATTGQISWTPTERQGSNTYQIAVAVTDASPEAMNEVQISVTNTFTITVLESNRPPVLVLSGPSRIPEQVPWTLSATGSDPDEPANPTVFTLVSGPPGLAVSEDGTISWTPTEAQGPSTNEVILRLTDSNPGAVNATTLSVTNQFLLVVEEVNTPPVLSFLDDRTAHAGEVIQFTVTASDADLPENSLTFSLQSEVAGAGLDPANHQFSWRPSVAFAGTTQQFVIRVSDGVSPDSGDFETFQISVDPLAPLEVSLLSHGEGRTVIKVDGPVDLDYVLEGSPNLETWTPLETRLTAPASFEFNDPEAPEPNRFYRVQVGP